MMAMESDPFPTGTISRLSFRIKNRFQSHSCIWSLISIISKKYMGWEWFIKLFRLKCFSSLFLLNLTMPMLTDIDTSGSEIDQDRFQDISPAGISIPLRTLVQTSFTTRKVIQHPSSKYEDTPRCLGLACDGSYLACGYDSGRFEVLIIHSFISHKFWVAVRFERLLENGG